MDPSSDAAPLRRSSIEKTPVCLTASSVFDALPDEIIYQILHSSDPDSFASLILLNSNWRRVSQQPHLYASQLAKCPSYATSHVDLHKKPLAELQALWSQEVKRNLFQAYLRPNQTIITLISDSISATSCPGGDDLYFSPSSPRGRHLLAYNSSRIYVLDICGSAVNVKRELKILRKPVSTCIKDDGTLLAILSTEMQVDIYDLNQSPPKRTQSLILDHSPRTIALSPCGSVLAAAYEGGIEVSSLSPGSLPTDRRAVKCDAVDSLSFSLDGTQLLGTTINSSPSNTVILTAPYYDPGSLMCEDDISPMWTTSILFPNTSRDCSHAALLQSSYHEEASYTFAYDRSFETFRAVRIDDLRNGTTYFTGPTPNAASQSVLLPCTPPAATYHGELVSAGFQGNEVWLYGIPEDLDAVVVTPPVSEQQSASLAGAGTDSSSTNGLSRRNSSLANRPTNANTRLPQWQILCDQLRNTFVAGSKVAEMDGVSLVKWVRDTNQPNSLKERLLIAARGGVKLGNPMIEEDDVDIVDGGRLTLLDFDYRLGNGTKTEITIELGTRDAEVLEEEQRDMETEVAIQRRRTIAQRGGRLSFSRASTMHTSSGSEPPVPQLLQRPTTAHLLSADDTCAIDEDYKTRIDNNEDHGNNDNNNDDDNDDDDDPLVPRIIGAPPTAAIRRANPSVTIEAVPSSPVVDEQEALDLPYSHASPRSGTTLRRAATAAAVNRQRNPVTPISGPVQASRRANGRTEHPHESDADAWRRVPPPPPYQEEDPIRDLPNFLRQPAVSPLGHSQPMPQAAAGFHQQNYHQLQPQHYQQQQQPLPRPIHPFAPPLNDLRRSFTQPPAAQQMFPSPISDRSESFSSLFHRDSRPRSASLNSDMGTVRHGSFSMPRPVSSSSTVQHHSFNADDISPPDTPHLSASVRRPSVATVSSSIDIGTGAAVAAVAPNSSSPNSSEQRRTPISRRATMPASLSPHLEWRQGPPDIVVPPLPDRMAVVSHAAAEDVLTPIHEHTFRPSPTVSTRPSTAHAQASANWVTDDDLDAFLPPHLQFFSPVSTLPIQSRQPEPSSDDVAATSDAVVNNSNKERLEEEEEEEEEQPPSQLELQIPNEEVASTLEVADNSHALASFPPLPRPEQMSSLNNRISQGAPRRLSGGYQMSRPVFFPGEDGNFGGGGGGSGSDMRSQRLASSAPEPVYWPAHMRTDADSDRPMIISTPTGIMGAHDSTPSKQSHQGDGSADAPIFAPVPIRSGAAIPAVVRPPVGRLETIWSTHSAQTTNPGAIPIAIPEAVHPQLLQPQQPPQQEPQPPPQQGSLSSNTRLSRRRSVLAFFSGSSSSASSSNNRASQLPQTRETGSGGVRRAKSHRRGRSDSSKRSSRLERGRSIIFPSTRSRAAQQQQQQQQMTQDAALSAPPTANIAEMPADERIVSGPIYPHVPFSAVPGQPFATPQITTTIEAGRREAEDAGKDRRCIVM